MSQPAGPRDAPVVDTVPEHHAVRPPDANRPKRVYYFDYLRLWATCAVVLLHSSATIFTINHRDGVDVVSHFTLADIGDSAGRFGVNCFFMVSGALLLAPAHAFRMGKQLARVIVPLVVWSVVYAGADALFAAQGLPVISGPSEGPASPLTAARRFTTADIAYHFWFVYVLVGIYLVVPLLRPLTALSPKRRARLLRYGLLLWLVFTIAVPAIRQIWPGHLELYDAAFPTVPAGYVGVALLGFYLHHHGVQFRGRQLPTSILLLGAAVGMSTVAVVTYLELTHRHGSVWALDNLTPQIVLYAGCVFLLAKKLFDRPGRHFAFVSLFSRLSYRIYLVHALVLHYLRSISPLRGFYRDQPHFSIPTMVVSTLVISFLVAWALDQIKPIRNYV